MSLRQYTWKRDPETQSAVLHWSENGGDTWTAFYKPVMGKLYGGEGMMRKLQELKKKGYAFIDNPQMREQSNEEDRGPEFVLDTYGEKDPWESLKECLQRHKEQPKDLTSSLLREVGKRGLKDELVNSARNDLEERALKELKAYLEGGRVEDILNFALEGMRSRLKELDQEEVIKFALEMYERNDMLKRQQQITQAYL